mmetsp:Transcript_9347/g.15527  ORF Transcript_9347/g.15527 Transcript_9347/m.15527 type:complete len:172 (-) Transcript_9347:187-702(-)
MFDSVDLNALLPRFNSTPAEQEEEEGFFPAMSWRERLIGCATCMVLGYMLSFGSFFRIKDLITGNPLPFVLHATIGNIIALLGSCFLTGPKNQLERMFKEDRKVASIAYLTSLTLTLVVAFAPIPGPKGLFLFILLIVQYLSVFWYCLSYVPFARDAVKGYCYRMIPSGEE